MTKILRQPIIVNDDWKVEHNQFMEVDPDEGNMHYFNVPLLLRLCKVRHSLKEVIDVEWKPQGNLKGSFYLSLYALYGVFNPEKNKLLWHAGEEKRSIRLQHRWDVVTEIEKTMNRTSFHDPRILSKRGVLSQPSESYRIELSNKGFSLKLADEIIKNGNREIQELLLNHPDVSREILEALKTSTMDHKLRNMAGAKLKQKKFRKG
ncbi:MAG: hypothetical protein OEW75_18835 [Cyclobacteriaceae bacterium]|nr:hypothetical protein [Cyclobacteriaceae bacterium]